MLQDTAMAEHARTHPIDGLKPLKFPSELSNEVEIEENGEVIVYRGTAFNLWFNGGDEIRGNASFAASKRTKTLVPVKRYPYWWKPWQAEVVDSKEVIKDELLWKVYVDDYDRGRSTFFIERGGKVVRDRTYSWGYRGELVGNTATKVGVILPDALLERVFAPIDQELLRLRAQVIKG